MNKPKYTFLRTYAFFMVIYFFVSAIVRVRKQQYVPAFIDVLVAFAAMYFLAKSIQNTADYFKLFTGSYSRIPSISSLLPEHIQGDLQEERTERIRNSGIFIAYFWYVYQVLASLWPQLCRVVARMVSKIASR